MTMQDVERWKQQAMAISPSAVKTTTMPVVKLLHEADGVARFAEAHWTPAADGSRPGLNVLQGVLAVSVSEEISSLTRACRQVHSQVLFPTDSNSGAERQAQLAEAENAASELEAACAYVLDDGVQEPADDAFAAAKERAAADSTQATLVQALVDYAAISESIADRLVKLGDFDPKLIARARELADAIGRSGPAQKGAKPSEHIDLRNRLISLLIDKVAEVRKASRYVFRKHSDIARKVTSAYQRSRRLEARRAKTTEKTAE